MRKDTRSPPYEHLRRLLREARDRSGLNQTKVAEQLGKKQSYVAKIENGERSLDVIEFIALAKIIGADPMQLLSDLLAEL